MTAPLVLSRPRAASPARPLSRRTAQGPRPPGPEDDARIAATARSLAVACLEIFAGLRRSESIARWVDRDLLERIDRRAQLRAELSPPRPPADPDPRRRVRAGTARVCRIDDGIAEVTVVVHTPQRSRAVAIRLELITTRWTMTALQTM
ncbi:hypothetical protein DFO66_10393 [Brevibacterium sanguinis]|uniref:Uncharacterized protein n=2 Tax=Brevibacterium TaxID=1696 RepID=A0A366ILP2_9MICO|nr:MULTISPECIES: Rv3235 family protein [Brevibacterium]RBP66150.1 hypothetical protein DFO66_10393 [Brevibacterium sanguinis]RBP72801.1 hypothetical protein DFO65_10392 [Brevibacterium celere]